jgi:hypothetical protein
MPRLKAPPHAPRAARARARALVRALGLCALSSMAIWPSACVLPVGPDFQDPLASPNFPPFFIAPDPAFGTAATATPTVLQTFSVQISDPNVGDNLTVRWIVDFPPFTVDTRPQPDQEYDHNASGQPLDKQISLRPSCLLTSLAKTPVHQIEVVVSDRGFVAAQDPTDLTNVPPGGYEIFGNWTLNLECP